MASIRKRGENSYLLVVSRGYDYQGNRLKPAQKTVHPPLGLTAKQTQKWLNEQAVLYEQEVKHTPAQPVDRSLTLAKYIEIWLEQVAPKKLAASTLDRDRQDIRRILPALGHYKLTELNKEILRDFYDAMRQVRRESTGEFLAEGTVEGIHSCLCGILSDAVEAGYITHNPAWRAYKKKGISKERPVADEETVQRLIAALETQSLKYEVYYKLILATGMRRGEACGLRWSDIDWRQRALHIRRNVVKLSRQPIMVKEPKTRAGVRVVYLSKDMCKLLRAWEKECQWEKEQQGDDELTQDDYLFQQPNGDPMVPCTFTYRFKMILRENGLPDDLNVHSLRHSSTTYKLKLNHGDLKATQGDTGHAQIDMITSVYAHILDEDRKINAQKFESAFYANPDLRSVRPPEEPKEPAPATLDLESLVEQLRKSPELANTLAALLASAPSEK